VAQTAQPVSLSVVTVCGTAPERFLAGQKLQQIDSATLAQFRFQTLGDALALTTSLALKSYGDGQLATVAFRGTSANHTAVLWNGININQPMTGQSDFSALPVAGFNKLAVQFGASASVVGSDAVGGSVLLGSTPNWQTGLHGRMGVRVGSFQNYQIQGSISYTIPRLKPGAKDAHSGLKDWLFSGSTTFYQNQLNNHYTNTQRRGYFLESSQTQQRGLIQNVYARNQQGHLLALNIWLNDNDLVVSPGDVNSRERTRTQATRLLATYETNVATLKIGWLRDVLDYAKGNFDAPSHSRTDQFLARAEREFNRSLNAPNARLTLRTGGQWAHYRTQVDGYGGQLITENRQDVYALARLSAGRWVVSANLRQAFVTRFSPPITPSLGAEFRVIDRAKTTLTARGSVGRSYRVPTLNERYWQQLGNPNLRPESGLNLEAGLLARFQPNARLLLTIDLTAYRNRVDDWSYWNPDYGYRVENLQLVVARGLEWSGAATYTTARWQAGGRLGYALTRSSQERAYNVYADDLIGKQLVYVPIHSGTANAFVQHKKIRLTAQMLAISRRYVTFDNSQFLPGYVLTNLLLEAPFRVGPLQATVQGQANNITDALVLNVKRNALPGRSFSININVLF
jgi:vitamin B12 transporter